jgi:hypothetical protein
VKDRDDRTHPAQHADLSALRPPSHRDHADRHLPVLLRLSGLRQIVAAQTRRLLRVLFLGQRAVPADPAAEDLLRLMIGAAGAG